MRTGFSITLSHAGYFVTGTEKMAAIDTRFQQKITAAR
jgi:hypothetical protein